MLSPTDTIGTDVVLYQASCLDVLPSLPDGSIDCVITDPPFSSRTHRDHDASAAGHAGSGHDGAKRQPLTYAPWTPEDVVTYVPEFCRVATGWVVVMTDHVLMPAVHAAMESAGRYVFAPIPFFAPGSRCRLSGDGPSSWTIWLVVARTAKQLRWGTLPGGYLAGSDAGWRERVHIGGKPVRLMIELVRDYSRPGDTILDPCMGSGTTILAAARVGRKAVGIERDEGHYATALRRLTAATGTAPDQLFHGIETERPCH